MRCSRCGVDKPESEYYRQTSGRPFVYCKSCAKAAATKWNKANPDRVLEYGRRWAAKHPFIGPPKPRPKKKERRRHYFRGRFVGPPRPGFEILWQRHRLIFLFLVFEFCERRRKAQRERERAWGRRNPDKIRVKYRIKKLRRNGVPGRYTKSDIDRLFLFQRGKCAACRCKLESFDVDHVMPIALGGTNDPENLQLLCKACNNRKGAIHPVEFMQQRGLLL